MNVPQRNKVLINLNAGAKLINFVITFCVIYDTREKSLLLKNSKKKVFCWKTLRGKNKKKEKQNNKRKMYLQMWRFSD